MARAELKKGDTVDFVVDCRTNPTHDSFLWAPFIKAQAGGGEWNAQTQFGGPGATIAKGLSAWEKYAQVLLLSNEFSFVD